MASLAAAQEEGNETAPMSRAQVVSLLDEEVVKLENKIGDINRALPDAELEKNVDIQGKRIQGLVKFLENVREDIAKLSERIGVLEKLCAGDGSVVGTVRRSSLASLSAPSTSCGDCGLGICLKH